MFLECGDTVLCCCWWTQCVFVIEEHPRYDAFTLRMSVQFSTSLGRITAMQALIRLINERDLRLSRSLLLLGISTSADTLYRTDTVLHGERKKVEFVWIICVPDNVVCWDCAAGRLFWLTGSAAWLSTLGVGQIEDTAGWYRGKSDQRMNTLRASNLIELWKIDLNPIFSKIHL